MSYEGFGSLSCLKVQVFGTKVGRTFWSIQAFWPVCNFENVQIHRSFFPAKKH